MPVSGFYPGFRDHSGGSLRATIVSDVDYELALCGLQSSRLTSASLQWQRVRPWNNHQLKNGIHFQQATALRPLSLQCRGTDSYKLKPPCNSQITHLRLSGDAELDFPNILELLDNCPFLSSLELTSSFALRSVPQRLQPFANLPYLQLSLGLL